MFYAHEGNSSDNAFTIGVSGYPVRSFRAFKTKAERQTYQDKVWKDSQGSKNVIFCKRKDVTEFFPNFYVSGNQVWSSYEDYANHN